LVDERLNTGIESTCSKGTVDPAKGGEGGGSGAVISTLERLTSVTLVFILKLEVLVGCLSWVGGVGWANLDSTCVPLVGRGIGVAPDRGAGE